ncbi:MAG TPA: DHA2 family efflux MFS transporter permease subunit [Terriglobales bacterium]|jgi:DHA2 family multidrug resistance protein|nr:DHA2 family efflux MFS transporter permease subunit [Terriglobales bacterium]
MSTANAITFDQAASKPKVNPWIIGVVVSMAAFMEVLDTSIANVALPHIAGNLGASNDESTWVLTSYLVSNAVVLPISGFLVSWLGRKRFFLMCIALFTASSFLCGIAPSLGILLLFRVLQGAFGGGLQPMTQAILADTFPPEKRGLAFALYGITIVCAPAIGPTLGGWITDNYSWRWIFYINVPVGVLALLLVSQLIEDPPHSSRLKATMASFDYIGFGLLAVGVGALQIALDKGQEDDWFGSRFITTLIILAAVGLVSLVIWEWRHKEPIVDVRMFKMFNFASCSLMMFVLGAVLFSSTVLLPQFLQTLLGYTAQTAGMVISMAAILLVFLLPMVGRLTGYFQARHILAFGWITLAVAMYFCCKQIDLLISFRAAAWIRIWQYLPVGFLFVPLTMAAYVGLPESKSNSAAGLINFMRNIGQSVGTSAVTTLLARRSQYHQSILAEHTRSPRFAAAVAGLTSRLTHVGLSLQAAQQQALARMYSMVLGQAQALSYVDIYWLLAVTSALMFLLCFLLAKNEPGKGGNVVID